MGTWKNFDEIEESLILDELLLLIEALSKKSKNNFRMLAAANGYEIPDDDYDDETYKGDEDLPDELLEAERALKRRKQEELGPEGSGATNTSFGTGLGYEVTPKIIQNLDQTVI